jgi:four helix bundle protein
MKDFKGLKVWEKSHLLTLAVYKATQVFPKDEIYGLTSQLRRAVSSIPTNIAEGCGRSSQADRARFFDIAFGSASEVEYQLLLSRDLGYLKDAEFTELDDAATEVKRMLAGLLKNLKAES